MWCLKGRSQLENIKLFSIQIFHPCPLPDEWLHKSELGVSLKSQSKTNKLTGSYRMKNIPQKIDRVEVPQTAQGNKAGVELLSQVKPHTMFEIIQVETSQRLLKQTKRKSLRFRVFNSYIFYSFLSSLPERIPPTEDVVLILKLFEHIQFLHGHRIFSKDLEVFCVPWYFAIQISGVFNTRSL